MVFSNLCCLIGKRHWSNQSEYLTFQKLSKPGRTRQNWPTNLFVKIAKWICPNCKIYLSKLLNVFVQIAKCICLNMQNMFESNCKRFISQIARWILLTLHNVFVSNFKCSCLKLHNRYVSNSKLYCRKFETVFVWNCIVYLSQIAKCSCLKLQNCTMYWSKLQSWVSMYDEFWLHFLFSGLHSNWTISAISAVLLCLTFSNSI